MRVALGIAIIALALSGCVSQQEVQNNLAKCPSSAITHYEHVVLTGEDSETVVRAFYANGWSNVSKVERTAGGVFGGMDAVVQGDCPSALAAPAPPPPATAEEIAANERFDHLIGYAAGLGLCIIGLVAFTVLGAPDWVKPWAFGAGGIAAGMLGFWPVWVSIVVGVAALGCAFVLLGRAGGEEE